MGPLNVEKLHKKCHFTDQLKKLQRRYEMTEDELHKKRAELREALHNDASPQLRPPRSNSRSTTEQQQPSSQSAVVAGNSNVVNVVDQDQQHHYKFKKYSGAQHSLPKMDMKSPARIIEEKSCENSSRSSRSATPPITSAAGLQLLAGTSNDNENNTNDSMPTKSVHLRRRSGTPASIRSRVSKLIMISLDNRQILVHMYY